MVSQSDVTEAFDFAAAEGESYAGDLSLAFGQWI
ncbi:hypothetical protein PSET11_01001 [Arthrobacter ulcerisalmonis]|uniref:Uncharacterized protein n=1 Tax=Arthrobacter ulcerisalmonis TaxID=2483813 RepID=A0A3P5X5K4_9MICC|nr:hypothetical protein PSET11_01001 [Arthrobacter ulcerisalmonis]